MSDGRMRWDCNKGGAGANCFNRLKRPKWEKLNDCFSRNSRFGDVDAVIDNGGERFLFVDWKCKEKTSIDNGQLYLFKALSRLPGVTILVVCGDAETMDISAYRVIQGGLVSGLQPSSFNDLRAWLCKWWRDGLPEKQRNDYDLIHPQPGDNLVPLPAQSR